MPTYPVDVTAESVEGPQPRLLAAAGILPFVK
jgi:hypothetical protein